VPLVLSVGVTDIGVACVGISRRGVHKRRLVVGVALPSPVPVPKSVTYPRQRVRGVVGDSVSGPASRLSVL
ncbi:hypothetical protein, partial [Xylella fastidiosa]|uniref:hypothetical protein n=1 Tax=Xylella fastidiosa TaxID=2371 RepID=UPI001EEA5C62